MMMLANQYFVDFEETSDYRLNYKSYYQVRPRQEAGPRGRPHRRHRNGPGTNIGISTKWTFLNMGF